MSDLLANRSSSSSSNSDEESNDNEQQGQHADGYHRRTNEKHLTKRHGKGVVAVDDFKEDNFYGNIRQQDDGVDFDTERNQVVMKNVHKTYLLGLEGVPALRGVSMNIKPGEFIVIFGTSGGGKTTMLNILGTIDKPTKGELFIGGTRITESTKDNDLSEIRLRKIGFVFQTFNLLSSLTALENVEMPLILDGRLSASERRQRAKEVLGLVGMTPRLDHVPSQLSGGEQQRVTIARALSNKPEMLLLDEPTGDLDTVNTLIVMKLLWELNAQEGITMAMVTHDVSLKYFAHRVVWMRDGKIQRIETVSDEKRRDTYNKICEELKTVQKQVKKTKKKGHGTTVELRDPTDYATHPLHVPREIPVIDGMEYAHALKAQKKQHEQDASDDSDSS